MCKKLCRCFENYVYCKKYILCNVCNYFTTIHFAHFLHVKTPLEIEYSINITHLSIAIATVTNTDKVFAMLWNGYISLGQIST